MSKYTASFQEEAPGIICVRFHKHPNKEYLDDYIGSCVLKVLNKKIVEVILFTVDTKRMDKEDKLEDIIRSGDLELIKHGFVYRFQERKKSDGELLGSLITLKIQ